MIPNHHDNNKNSRYLNFFIKRLLHFMDHFGLFPQSSKAIIGVSGGIDSITLLFSMHKLLELGRVSQLLVAHLNHNTRKENATEESLVREYAQKLSLPFFSKTVDWKEEKEEGKVPANFEQLARKIRYQFFKQLSREQLGAGHRIYIAHNLDDSFEWSLMQSFKSGQVASSLGIPLKNGAIARPFLCFSRAQICKLAEEQQLKYLEDPSNKNLRFERNYLRYRVIPRIASRFPGYLRHYVSRSKRLANQLGLAATEVMAAKEERAEKEEKEFGKIKEVSLIAKFYKHPFASSSAYKFREELTAAIFELSEEKRGSIDRQLDRAWRALTNVNNAKWGPLSFSGGVLVYPVFPWLAVIGRSGRLFFSQFDLRCFQWLKLKEKMENATANSQIPGKSITLNEIVTNQQFLKEKIKFYQKNFRSQDYGVSLGVRLSEIFPFWLISSQDAVELGKLCPSSRRVHPLFPLTTDLLIERGWWFRSRIDFTRIIASRAGAISEADYLGKKFAFIDIYV